MWPQISFSDLNLFWLILARMIGFFLLSPFIRCWPLPSIVNAGLCGVLSLLVFVSSPQSLPINGLLILTQVLLGYLLGFFLSLVFEIARLIAQSLALVGGLNADEILDPSFSFDEPLLQRFFLISFMVLFLASDSHHFLIRYLCQISFCLPDKQRLLNEIFIQLPAIFTQAIQILAGPMSFLFLVILGLALTARLYRKTPIFWIGLPVQIFVTFFSLIATIQILGSQFSTITTKALEKLLGLFFTF